ncbi:hypothetical protein WICPIJ_005652 [Wickerhamomyces pijperi]|uniref:Uncharacterized protein n=1 Tax=Wickerhamomyces pijperi TaxID=599730 RepID=A0A9P8Q5I8_WICPI|nr:hypothetical protein WICPIJ_005652 [Wickerhamomyces pijperi]
MLTLISFCDSSVDLFSMTPILEINRPRFRLEISRTRIDDSLTIRVNRSGPRSTTPIFQNNSTVRISKCSLSDRSSVRLRKHWEFIDNSDVVIGVSGCGHRDGLGLSVNWEFVHKSHTIFNKCGSGV